MLYAQISNRFRTIAQLCELAVNLMNHDDPADRGAVPDLLSLIVEQIEAIARNTDNIADQAELYAKTAKKLYRRNGANDDETAEILYTLSDLLTA